MQEINPKITDFLNEIETYRSKCKTNDDLQRLEKYFEANIEYAQMWFLQKKAEAIQNANADFNELSRKWKLLFCKALFGVFNEALNKIQDWKEDKSEQFEIWAKDKQTPKAMFAKYESDIFEEFSKILDANTVRNGTIAYMRNFYANTFAKFLGMIMGYLPKFHFEIETSHRLSAIQAVRESIKVEFEKMLKNYDSTNK